MRFSDDTLMAYVDGELDADTRAAFDDAMASDPDLADAVALQIENGKALQAKLCATFDTVLNEEPPLRLINAVRPPVGIAQESEPVQPQPRWALPHWGALIASLLIGVVIGYAAFQRRNDPILIEHGSVTARALLEAALSSQSGNVLDRETGIQTGVSFLSKRGEYCRTFMLRDAQALGGLACRRGSRWAIDALTPMKTDATGAYRMAGAAVPALILGIVEDTIAGDPLDAEQEAEARNRQWQR